MGKQQQDNLETKLFGNNKKEVRRALKKLGTLLPLGFTDENFCAISQCMRVLRSHMFLSDIEHLEHIWRNCYTDDQGLESLDNVLDTLRSMYT